MRTARRASFLDYIVLFYHSSHLLTSKTHIIRTALHGSYTESPYRSHSIVTVIAISR